MQIQEFQQQGRRPYQEDAFLIDNSQGLYMVCDGVGGTAKGDLASQTTVTAIQSAMSDAAHAERNAAFMSEIVSTARQTLLNTLENKPEAAGMGTTLAMAYVADDRAYITHVGDSRVYVIRPSDGFVWKTRDHSHVQELFDAGILKSEDEMATHPMRNRITRAIQANEDYDISMPDIHVIKNIRQGDILVLCTDGALEPFSPNDFVALLTDPTINLEQKRNLIQEACAEVSSDNNTCILLEFEATDFTEQKAVLPLVVNAIKLDLPSDDSDEEIEELIIQPEVSSPDKKEQTKKFKRLITYLLLFSAAFALSILMFTNRKTNKGGISISPDASNDSSKATLMYDSLNGIKPEVRKVTDALQVDSSRATEDVITGQQIDSGIPEIKQLYHD